MRPANVPEEDEETIHKNGYKTELQKNRNGDVSVETKTYICRETASVNKVNKLN